jgi:TPP-dependent 2-oxoacid decarboxylase
MAAPINLYRVELHHHDHDGKFYDLYAQSEDAVTEIAIINAPAGTYIERVVPLRMDVRRPPQNEAMPDDYADWWIEQNAQTMGGDHGEPLSR